MTELPETDAALRAVGTELRLARQNNGLTRRELAERLIPPIAGRTYATYETGSRQWPLSRLIEICRVLGVGPTEVLRRALKRIEFTTVCPHCGNTADD